MGWDSKLRKFRNAKRRLNTNFTLGKKINKTVAINKRKNNNQKKIDNELFIEEDSSDTFNPLNKKRKRNETESAKISWNDFNIYYPADGYNNMSVEEKKEWISATNVKNYLLRDPLIDWFDLYYLEKGFNDIPEEQRQITPENMNLIITERNTKKKTFEVEKNKLNVLFEMGHKFEDYVIQDLKTKYSNHIKKVVTNTVTPDLNQVTLKYMLEGIPIIEQAALYNFSNRTFGVADLLIRSDWFEKIFVDQIISENEKYYKAPKLNGNYHYRVVDIKWTTMYLCSNGKNLRNSHRFSAYKGQLAIYNAALGILQGYTPNTAYIMSKAWNLNGNQDHGYNCYKLLGQVDYSDFDSKYILETQNAIRWVRNVRYNGNKWSCNKPSVPELYPNMCNKFDSPYHNIKKELCDQLNEITQIWMVGVKHRKIAHSKGIMGWDDPRCNSETIGMHGKKLGPIVDKIIRVNRDNIGNILPSTIINNMENWQTKTDLDFYLDFEGITGCLYDKNICLENSEIDSQLIFMIGVGYENKGNWEYKTFMTNSISRSEESRIFREFIDFITKKKQDLKSKLKPRFFHWSPAEKSVMNMINKRYKNEFSKWINSVTWIDMCKVFTNEPIVIKGATKFNLKEIAKTMVMHGMIQSSWDNSGPDNGLMAMMEAINYYHYMENGKRNKKDDKKYVDLMISITDYNEIDCKVIWEIVKYLRQNHCKN
ncbi:hypothetical protein Indivirus_2_58 [Indivirus ILV1]|uniref:Uncharacterized protein n=1 Tax=Indivirus ILV1 TaxID=1977633 RepID=A0A1V0SD89_9VIRU|nr:hypothetical protein Indivirus_2_58 [Indivirus ILV1]